MNITLEHRSLAMLMTADRIKIMYSSILLTIKLKKTFKILKKYIIFFMKKYMNSRQYIMNYCIDLDIVGAIVLG